MPHYLLTRKLTNKKRGEETEKYLKKRLGGCYAAFIAVTVGTATFAGGLAYQNFKESVAEYDRVMSQKPEPPSLQGQTHGYAYSIWTDGEEPYRVVAHRIPELPNTHGLRIARMEARGSSPVIIVGSGGERCHAAEALTDSTRSHRVCTSSTIRDAMTLAQLIDEEIH